MKPGSWERGYLSSVGGVCLVVGDKLYFYYGAFQGNEAHAMPLRGTPAEQASLKARGPWSGMYANASTGLATLRRDGFAAMEAGTAPGTLTTRPVVFHGGHLFVNADCPHGQLRVEVEDLGGHAIGSWSTAQCLPITVDSTLHEVRWQDGADLAALAGRPVRFRFTLTRGSLYSFWVSADPSGASQGYVAGGGPGFESDTDREGRAAYRAAQLQGTGAAVR
jgi:hypothetical protein